MVNLSYLPLLLVPSGVNSSNESSLIAGLPRGWEALPCLTPTWPQYFAELLPPLSFLLQTNLVPRYDPPICFADPQGSTTCFTALILGILQDPLGPTRKQIVGFTILLGGQKLVVDERYLRSLKIKHSSGRGRDQGPTVVRFAPRAKTLTSAICRISHDLSNCALGLQRHASQS